MTTLTELQLAVAAIQPNITYRKECELLLESKSKTFKNRDEKSRSQERKNVTTAQENQIRAVHNTLLSLRTLVLESNNESIDIDALTTRFDNEHARAVLLLEVQFTHQKNKLITKDQEVYDNADTMEPKNKFHHQDNQTQQKKQTNSANYFKALAKLSSSELDYFLMFVQQHETDLGRGIKQGVSGMQTILEERRTTRNDNQNEMRQNKSESDKEKEREHQRKRYRDNLAIKPHFVVLTRAQGMKNTRKRLEGMTIELYQRESAQARDAELKWDGNRWDFIELANNAKPVPSRTSSRARGKVDYSDMS